MKLPTKEECFRLLKKYNTLPNVLEHSIMVNKVANYLAEKLKENGVDLNLELIDRASLLHDIAKTKAIEEKIPADKEEHHIDGEKILIKEGYQEVGKLVRAHSLKEIEKLKTWEEKIINYADTRVRHNKIVSVRERLDDLDERYDIPEEMRIDEIHIFNVEKEIFDIIKESPDKLREIIK